MRVVNRIEYYLDDNDADAINKVIDICETLHEEFEEIDESFADTLNDIVIDLHNILRYHGQEFIN